MTVPTKEILADHLSQMIQMKTVSNSDVNKVDWSEFEKLHKLFETLYPHVYEVMEVDRVGRAGLQFHYHPKETAKKPLLLMSHQDVVEIGDRSQWSHDPFQVFSLMARSMAGARRTANIWSLVNWKPWNPFLPKASGLITTSTCLWATVRKCILKMMWTEPSASWTI